MNKTLIASSLLLSLSANAFADDTQLTTTTVVSSPTAPTPTLNCHFRLPATAKIDIATVSAWAEKAAVQAFDFSHENADGRFAELKYCFTEQGWQGFNDALKQSGNIDAIKSQKLTVSSQVDGQSKLTPVKDNEWKVSVPLQVVYQNDKEKLTQLLSVDLLIGRKVSGDLGILQMIAAPREQAPK